jgi:energy-coupling factor transporter transmembrane protein EcfT
MSITSFIFKPPKDDIFWMLAGIFLFVTSLYIGIKIFSATIINWTAFILPIIYFALSILFFLVINLRRRYKIVDKGKKLFLDKKNRELKIVTPDKTIIILNSEIDNVEIFESWNTNPLFSDLGYMKLNMKEGVSIIITKYTANQYDLQSLFKDKALKITTRLLNRL